MMGGHRPGEHKYVSGNPFFHTDHCDTQIVEHAAYRVHITCLGCSHVVFLLHAYLKMTVDDRLYFISSTIP